MYAAREEKSRSSLWTWSRNTRISERKLQVEGRIDSVVSSPTGARMALLVQTAEENRDETEIWVADTRGAKEPWRIAGREEGSLRSGKFVLREWSPDGRYLLAEQHYPTRYTCTDLWVFDAEGVPE